MCSNANGSGLTRIDTGKLDFRSLHVSIPCGVVQSTLEGGLTGTCCDVQATFLRCRSAALRHRSNALRHRSKELKHRSNELRHRRNLLNAVSEHVMRHTHTHTHIYTKRRHTHTHTRTHTITSFHDIGHYCPLNDRSMTVFS